MKHLIEDLRTKVASLGINNEIDRRVRGAYVDCIVMAKEAAKYDRVMPTVDIAILDEDTMEIVMGYRKGHTRFIGGFVDLQDETLEQAAARELAEETGITNFSHMKNVGSHRIDDPRYPVGNSYGEGIMTTMFVVSVRGGGEKPMDDIEGLVRIHASKFVNDSLEEYNMAPEHAPLIELFSSYLKNLIGK